MIDIKLYEINFGYKKKYDAFPASRTYRSWFVAHEFSMEAYDTHSRIIRVNHSRKPGKERISFYKIIGDSKERYKVFHVNCKGYRRILAGLRILRCWRWWRRVTRRDGA